MALCNILVLTVLIFRLCTVLIHLMNDFLQIQSFSSLKQKLSINVLNLLPIHRMVKRSFKNCFTRISKFRCLPSCWNNISFTCNFFYFLVIVVSKISVIIFNEEIINKNSGTNIHFCGVCDHLMRIHIAAVKTIMSIYCTSEHERLSSESMYCIVNSGYW